MFKLPLVTLEGNAATSCGVAETVNIIEEVSGLELTLMPVIPRWTVAKQCLANPGEFEDIEVWLIEKGLDAADLIWMLWIAMHNGAKVDWLMCPHCNRAVVDWEKAESIH